MIFDDKYFIGRKIKSFRKKRGLTQAELAEKAYSGRVSRKD